MAVTAEDFWLFQGLSERADVTGECFVTSFPWGYLFCAKNLSFSVPFGKLNRKLKTPQSPAYVACVHIAAVCYEHNLQLYLQVRLEWAQLFWSEWVQTTLFYRIRLMRSEVSWDFWIVSGNVAALRLAVVGKVCIYSSAPDTVCDWLHFRSCGDVCGMLSLVVLPHERSLLEKCVWLCPPHEKVLLKG